MPTYTGTQIARAALKAIGILDPVEAGAGELIADALEYGTDLLDSWRTERLVVGALTRTPYSLASNTQTYTIGSGGTFDQDYPSEILRWSVIPDDDAADPVEQHRGRPLTDDEWQAIRVKSTTGAYPTRMWYDRRYAAGLGRCHFWPIPNNADVDVVLYMQIPALTSLVAATSYDLAPGVALALKTGLAQELAESGSYEVSTDIAQRVARRHARAMGRLKRWNNRTPPTPIRKEFATIGRARPTLNIYTDS